MPPQKSRRRTLPLRPTKKSTISLTPEPSNITDQERRAKLEALQRARVEKTAHTLEQIAEQLTHENDDEDDDDEAVDKEQERIQQKIQQLQKERKFCEPTASKKKGL
jgi:hypothetical protein